MRQPFPFQLTMCSPAAFHRSNEYTCACYLYVFVYLALDGWFVQAETFGYIDYVLYNETTKTCYGNQSQFVEKHNRS